jgi:hypothetical protein
VSGIGFRYLIGIEPAADLTAAETAAFGDFYERTHLPEVVAANEGFVEGVRFEIEQPDHRLGIGPRWLAMYSLSSMASARGYMERQQVAGAGIDYTPGPVPWGRMTVWWRVMLAVRHEAGAGHPAAGRILLTSFEPGRGQADQATSHYLETTVPAVMEQTGSASATTFEVLADLGALSSPPRWLTLYAGPSRPAAQPDGEVAWLLSYRRTGEPHA